MIFQVFSIRIFLNSYKQIFFFNFEWFESLLIDSLFIDKNDIVVIFKFKFIKIF